MHVFLIQSHTCYTFQLLSVRFFPSSKWIPFLSKFSYVLTNVLLQNIAILFLFFEQHAASGIIQIVVLFNFIIVCAASGQNLKHFPLTFRDHILFDILRMLST